MEAQNVLEVNTMNKSELVVALAQKAELSKKDAEKALTAFVEVVTETLKAGDKVQLVGFGTFESKVRHARTARNPRTGEEIQIESSKTASFKVGKALKDSLN
ncbi:MAG: HU family DNA-binding protein [Clostridia bacterium]|nr:HU family DNA-binding protein [Clostridia bacterium]